VVGSILGLQLMYARLVHMRAAASRGPYRGPSYHLSWQQVLPPAWSTILGAVKRGWMLT
jgi:hypothetical protein